MNKMLEKYMMPYLRALATPLLEMQETLDEEYKVLKKICKEQNVVDLGCGVGRPAHKLEKICRRIWLVDNDQAMVDICKERFKESRNISVSCTNAIQTPFLDNEFSVSLATYNFIGCLDEPKKLVPEMKRITKANGLVFLSSWNTGIEATMLLKKYYPSIGIKIERIDSRGTKTDHGYIRRHPVHYLESQLKENKLEVVESGQLGKMWNYAIGKVIE